MGIQNNFLARKLEARLWSGFSRRALAELETYVESARVSAKERSLAHLALARWHIAHENIGAALLHAQKARKVSFYGKTNRRPALIEAWCLSAREQGSRARAVLRLHRLFGSKRPAIALSMANSYAPCSGSLSDRMRLDWINRLYRREGLSSLCKARENAPLTFFNLAAQPSPPCDAPVKVSVLMPAYNCEGTISHALQSLMSQSWTNLEIIVADDASTDGTADIVKAHSERDARIRYIRLPVNQGAYAARNAALAVATGKFITTHDSDDWSHPQKIERQARHLIDDREAVANFSFWARTDEELFFVGKLRDREALLHMNFSSCMFRKTVFEELGAWNEVRISADAELVRRIRKAYGPEFLKAVVASAPLSFSLVSPHSLTQYSTTSGKTVWHGVRRSYTEASRYWLENVAEVPRIDPGIRPFPVPGTILPVRCQEISADIVLVGDLSRQEKGSTALIAAIGLFRDRLQSVAVFHWGRFDGEPAEPPCREIMQLAQDKAIVVVSPGTSVRCHTAIVLEPTLLLDLVDLPPKLAASRLFLIGDVKVMSKSAVHAIASVAQDLCGRSAKWVGAFDEVDLH